MAKIKSVYICSECGYETPKWVGKCPSCGEWNTMNEEIKDTAKPAPAVRKRTSSTYAQPYSIREISTDDEHRYDTGCHELNRVLGGGIVKGSLILLGGDPGIGKSTVLMQICQFLGDTLKILYVSGEESKRQLKLRALRLEVDSPNLFIMTETDVEIICEQIKTIKPDLVMIDSIQTMNLSELSSSPGSVTQVRECTNILMRTAKSLDIPMFVVGHVNKEGSIAGPKVLEHIVDFDFVSENRMKQNTPNYVLRNVRRWAGLVSAFIVVVFLWWHFDSEDTAAETSSLECKSCCGGMLFAITFKSILFACCGIGGSFWAFVPHPILEEVITCLLLVLFTAGSLYLLVKRRLWVLPQAAILAVVVLHFFTANYLYNILLEHLALNLDAFQYGAFFNNVASCCSWVFFLVTVVLYRRELDAKPVETCHSASLQKESQ